MTHHPTNSQANAQCGGPVPAYVCAGGAAVRAGVRAWEGMPAGTSLFAGAGVRRAGSLRTSGGGFGILALDKGGRSGLDLDGGTTQSADVRGGRGSPAP